MGIRDGFRTHLWRVRISHEAQNNKENPLRNSTFYFNVKAIPLN